MRNAPAKLVGLSGPTAEEEHPLAGERTTLGRDPANDISLPDEEVSRRHAQIVRAAGRYLIEDLGSTNGTFVNGRRVDRPAPLRDGDVIYLGESASFRFHLETEAPDLSEQKTLLYVPEEPVTRQELFHVRHEAPIAGPEMRTVAFRDPGEVRPTAARPRSRRTVIGCGCLVLLAIVACSATLFLLDAFAPDTLYCGRFEALFRLAGFTFACG
jgi:hypothetical protein